MTTSETGWKRHRGGRPGSPRRRARRIQKFPGDPTIWKPSIPRWSPIGYSLGNIAAGLLTARSFRIGLGEETIVPFGQKHQTDTPHRDSAGTELRVQCLRAAPPFLPFHLEMNPDGSRDEQDAGRGQIVMSRKTGCLPKTGNTSKRPGGRRHRRRKGLCQAGR